MADLTPEERAGLDEFGMFTPEVGIHQRLQCEAASHPWCEPLYTLDADRLAELVREGDEAVAHLRKLKVARPPFADIDAARRFLAALDREVPDDH